MSLLFYLGDFSIINFQVFQVPQASSLLEMWIYLNTCYIALRALVTPGSQTSRNNKVHLKINFILYSNILAKFKYLPGKSGLTRFCQYSHIFPCFPVFYNTCEPFHDGGPNHIETSPLICSGNQWTGFYMIGTSIVRELNNTRKR